MKKQLAAARADPKNVIHIRKLDGRKFKKRSFIRKRDPKFKANDHFRHFDSSHLYEIHSSPQEKTSPRA